MQKNLYQSDKVVCPYKPIKNDNHRLNFTILQPLTTVSKNISFKGNDYIKFLLDEQFSTQKIHKKIEREVGLTPFL
ncbi:MAG: hypothetical protein AAF673_03155 [Pseudomonadota bacterium]